MAPVTYRVWSGGSNTAPYDTWAKAATAFGTASAAADINNDAGDLILVHKGHAETLSANQTWTTGAVHTTYSPMRVIWVDKDNSDLPVDSYADVTTGITGATNSNNIYMVGDWYIWGGKYILGSDPTVNFSNDSRVILERCEYGYDSSGNERFTVATGDEIYLIDSLLSFKGGGSHYAQLYGDANRIIMIGGAITAANHPANLVSARSGAVGNSVELRGVDLTGVQPTTSWLSSSQHGNSVELYNCDLPTTPPELIHSTSTNTVRGIAVHCGGIDGRYYTERSLADDTIVHSTTTYRTGGPKYDGTNEYSFSVFTVDVTDDIMPFRQLLAIVDAGSLSGKDLTVHITHDNTDNSGLVQNDEIWLEFHALDDTSGVHFETTRGKPTVTPTSWVDDTGASWTNGETYDNSWTHTWASGATSGVVYVYICVAKSFTGAAGSTLFVCPKVDVA